MLAEVHAQPLIFGANEHCADYVTSNEKEEEAVVEARMVQCIENGKENQAACSD